MDTSGIAKRYMIAHDRADESLTRLDFQDRFEDAIERHKYLTAVGVGLRAVVAVTPVFFNALRFERSYRRNPDLMAEYPIVDGSASIYNVAHAIAAHGNE